MDPRGVLGLGPAASRSEVQRAYRRLSARVDPKRGGTAELKRVVGAAYQAATRGGTRPALGFDPHLLLGVPADAGESDAKAAYRRLALLVHPDQGGTDELFRMVGTAYDLVLHPRAGATTATTWDEWLAHHRWTATTWAAPGPPPPPGPYVPPPMEDRLRPSRWWAVWTVVVGVGSMAALGIGFAAAWVIPTPVGLPMAVMLGVALTLLLRSGSSSFLRSIVVLVGRPVRPGAPEDPDGFLAAACLDAPVAREREETLYHHYLDWCSSRGVIGIAPWRFVEHLRSLGLLYVRASAWESGVWVGIRLRQTV